MEVGLQSMEQKKTLAARDKNDVLTYLADMLSELQDVASRQGCVTLAGLLALSHVEALHQASDAKRSQAAGWP